MKQHILLCVIITASLSASEQTNKTLQSLSEQSESTVALERVENLVRALRSCDYDEATSLLQDDGKALANAIYSIYPNEGPVLAAAIKYCPSQFVKLLIDSNAEVTKSPLLQLPYTCLAAEYGNPATFMVLLNAGATYAINNTLRSNIDCTLPTRISPEEFNLYRYERERWHEQRGIYRDLSVKKFGELSGHNWIINKIQKMITAKENNPTQTSFLSCFDREDAEFLYEHGDTTVKTLMDAEEQHNANEQKGQKTTD